MRCLPAHWKEISVAAPSLHPVPIVSPWYHIGIDFVGPVSPKSHQGNAYILTISDYFTKCGSSAITE